MGLLVCAGGLAPQATGAPRHLQPAVFFGAATLLLVGGIFLLADYLRGLECRTADPPGSPWALGLRNAVRRRGRSLAVAGLLAAGVFMVSAMNTMHADARKGDHPGTGGFSFIGSTDLPVYEDLNAAEGRETYGLEDSDAVFVPFRRRPGDEASCLNLNRAQVPSVLGVDVNQMVKTGKFEFTGPVSGFDSPWQALDRDSGDGTIPAIMDLNSAMWALQKGVGDVIEVPNSTGGMVKLKLVALLKNTILQGHAIIGERHFVSLYPDTPGYRIFLIKTAAPDLEKTATFLTRQFQNRGLALETASDRLSRLQEVQNTYLRIFSALGGLGLLLSTAALGLLVARNVLERRGELALLQATGFTMAKIRQTVLGEHLPLFGIAFVLGLAATALAIWPHLQEGGDGLPLTLLATVLGGLALGGLLFCWLAAHLALRRPLLTSLRQE
jgi:hypothetical protein